jgi:phospholipid N-methyltransferase
MPDSALPQKPVDDRIVFLREFLRYPQQVGSIIPSSRFLERRVVRLAGVEQAHTVVELGAGTGGLTRAILSKLPRTGRLLVIEINPRFCRRLRNIDDPRLIVHRGNAQQLCETLAACHLPAPEAVISGIPFSTMSRDSGERVLRAIRAALAPGGCFVAYQFRRQVDDLARPLLGAAHTEMALLNIPPMRLYRWTKQPG